MAKVAHLIADSLSRLLGAKAHLVIPFARFARASFFLEKTMKYTFSAKIFILALVIAFIACSVAMYEVIS